MFIKTHRSYRLVAAICDSELIGKKFEEGNKMLDVRESFYKGEEIQDETKAIEKLIDLAKEDATFNIIGRKSVQCALRAGIIAESGVSSVQGIPFALGLL